MRDKNGRFIKGQPSIFKGYKHTIETRKKQSLSHKGKQITWNTGHPQGEETRNKIRVTNKTKYLNPELRERQRYFALKRWEGHIKQEKVKRVTIKSDIKVIRVRKSKEELLERKRFRNQRYKANKRNALGSHTFAQWQELKEKYNNMCLCCKQFEPIIKLTEDHVIPLSMGGSDSISNIQPLCQACNTRKHAKFISYLPTENSYLAES